MAATTCYYCGVEGRLGYDRVEPGFSYEDDNTVACCSACNYSKGGWNEAEFRQACSNMIRFLEFGERTRCPVLYRLEVRQKADTPTYCTTASAWQSDDVTYYEFNGERWRRRVIVYRRSRPYYQCKYEAGRRGYEFKLVESEYASLCAAGCAYCGLLGVGVGVDRVSNEGGYEVGNCQGLCSACNFMKRELGSQEMVRLAGRVNEMPK